MDILLCAAVERAGRDSRQASSATVGEADEHREEIKLETVSHPLPQMIRVWARSGEKRGPQSTPMPRMRDATSLPTSLNARTKLALIRRTITRGRSTLYAIDGLWARPRRCRWKLVAVRDGANADEDGNIFLHEEEREERKGMNGMKPKPGEVKRQRVRTAEGQGGARQLNKEKKVRHEDARAEAGDAPGCNEQIRCSRADPAAQAHDVEPLARNRANANAQGIQVMRGQRGREDAERKQAMHRRSRESAGKRVDAAPITGKSTATREYAGNAPTESKRKSALVQRESQKTEHKDGYTPECKSLPGPETLILKYTRPRRP
ncbi:hypothetical protein B0H16DRAFT_1455827 [Mycena metata]|uniref:Uncharacterized protein n=1 Tax=Mycena metata TaxID=1033252 RepID=A0AAD7JCV6_9AGAR|nr:hypothetical protein B0H16DRAFT_1455827 [Mycena metata]